LIFVSVFRYSVSDPFPYLSYRPCLPLRLSFPLRKQLMDSIENIANPSDVL
jgi:hypothetical protein